MKQIKYLILYFVFLLVISNSNILYAFDYPGEVDVAVIKFNYDLNSYSQDALSIKSNASSAVYQNEWVFPIWSLPFAYIKGQSNRKIKVYFHHNQNYNKNFIMTIGGGPISGIGFGNMPYTTVNFPANNNGYSNETTFQLNGSVPGTVGKRQVKFGWGVVMVNGMNYCLDMGSTGWHNYYAVLAPPQAPMDKPWISVLDYACVWASGENTEPGVAEGITIGAYNNFGKDYWGGGTHAPGTKLHLTSLLASNWADCRDMSAVVHVFTKALGGSNTTVRLINSPLPYNEDFRYKRIDPVGAPTWTTGTWNFHQVAYLSGVYDACL